ncbi:MAG TPA: TetR/AcrR family transcriptional regulator C-terminal domain-containing protein [Anaerolineales bacterium]|nr:TetR/AcrR family transcriptional regulator C-terminal domain-containing protein [Anaerolineales bacterium]HRJ58758.1 TetR/AcrR family transcriptional regulator C-terminal domain-containing protein [Anaerolineales bacterium]HRK89173.1 TetR/AcrR family transcriptional regulator C-terminal domain-containing protein [Anaerolineales bacterium]
MPRKSSPVNIDPRVKRTRRLLRDALVSLILKKDFASITIREITERAEVAYITFYRHYESLDQLLMEVLDEGLAELMTHIETLAKQSDTSALETEGRLIFEYIEQKADLFRILLKSQSVTRVRRKVVRNISTVFQKSCVPLERLGNQTTIEIASNHIATSLLSLIEWWLENNMKPTPTEMGKVYKSLIIDSTVGAVSSLSAMKK